MKHTKQRSHTLAHMIWSKDIMDFETSYREVAEAGFTAVVMGAERGQLDLRKREEALEAARILERLGLTAPACHGLDMGPGGLNDPDDEARRALVAAHVSFMGNAAEIGCRTYVVHIGPKRPDEPEQASWDRVRQCVEVLAARAEEVGIIMALENGLKDYLVSNEELLALAEEVAGPWVGVCYDSGHAHVTGDATEVLKMLAPHVVTVHLHDNDGAGDQHLIPGQGTIAWEPLVRALDLCPRLVHVETEAVNSPSWPATPEVWDQRRVYERYAEVLGIGDWGLGTATATAGTG